MAMDYFLDIPWHHAPDGHWGAVDEQRKKHRLIGRKALFDHKALECVRADDDIVVFRITDSSELIVGSNKIADIKWINF